MSLNVHMLEKNRHLKPLDPAVPARGEVEAAFRTITSCTGDDPGRDGLLETPARVTRIRGVFYRRAREKSRADSGRGRLGTAIGKVEERDRDGRLVHEGVFQSEFPDRQAAVEAIELHLKQFESAGYDPRGIFGGAVRFRNMRRAFLSNLSNSLLRLFGGNRWNGLD